MNYYALLIIAFIEIGCSSQQKIIENQKTIEKFYVYQIDTLNNYYLVYAKKGDEIFKIVSKNEKSNNCNMIKVNNSYNFDLYAQSSIKPIINGEEVAIVTIIDVMCYNFENDTKICTDRKNGIYDLYYARNIRGLCLI